MTILERAVQQGLIIFEDKDTYIRYVDINKRYPFGAGCPEEEVRAKMYCDLILNYGYKKENIDTEVLCQQGGNGNARADIVIFYPNKKEAFTVIECKQPNTTDPIDKIRKQTRSYAKSDELKTSQYYGYKIGDHPLIVFTSHTNNDKEISKLPYNYTETEVFAFIVDGSPMPPPPPHYKALTPSTPYDLKRIFKSCHDVIWNRGEKNQQDAFDEFSKLLFLKMADELERDQRHLDRYFFQTSSNETRDELEQRLLREYKRVVKEKKVEGILTDLNISAYQLYEIVSKLEHISLIETDNDPKGLAFETFVQSYMKGEFGQYFTPRNIVEFMLNVSPIEWSSEFRNTSRVLDPCCGSGSFLVHSINTFRRRYPKKKQYWTKFANESVFGVELNDKISVTAKINIALHDDGHDNIKNADGLNTLKLNINTASVDLILTNPPFGTVIPNVKASEQANLDDFTKFYAFTEFEITEKRYDQIEEIRKTLSDTLDLKTNDAPSVLGKKYMDNIDSEIIFFEQYYRLLKVGGIAEIVIPDGILTNSSSQYVRDFISERFRILAIISLPQYAFSHYGAGVKSSIIILKKHDPSVSLRIKSAKLKYLTVAVKAHNADLKRLEHEKKTFVAHYAEAQELVRKQADDERSIKAQLSNNAAELKKQLTQNQKFHSDKIKAIQQSEPFKDWKKAKDDYYNNQIKALKDHIYELANGDFKKFEKEFDYPIFMAIADHIGYDATGRETNQNDLTTITPELCRFFQAVEKGIDPFFALALP